MLSSPSTKTDPFVSHGFMSAMHSLLGVTPPAELQVTEAQREHVFSKRGTSGRQLVPRDLVRAQVELLQLVFHVGEALVGSSQGG